MLLHSIEPYKAPPVHYQTGKKGRWRGTEGSDEHMRFIFNRASQGHRFKEGDCVLYKGHHVQILSIYTEFEHIEWDVLKPKFIEVYDDADKDLFLVHPNDLSRKR